MSANDNTATRAIDEPLTDPEGDLLEMDQHAKALANYIKQDRKLPFTVGIFGEWGEGKTTMVNFLKRHLTPPPIQQEGPPDPFNFVSFSAWPYTTSEKLWRALILEIAKVIYHVDPNEPAQANKPGAAANNDRADLVGKFTNFLHGDLFRKQEPPPQLSEFDKLVKELDRTDYGKISKRTPSTTADQEAMMSAVVSGALSVLGTVSPLAEDDGELRLGGGPFTWTTNTEERNKLWQARHDAYWAVIGMRPGAKAFATDVCVPLSRLAECVIETQKDIKAIGLIAPIAGHVGDGNFHCSPLIDMNDPAEITAARVESHQEPRG